MSNFWAKFAAFFASGVVVSGVTMLIFETFVSLSEIGMVRLATGFMLVTPMLLCPLGQAVSKYAKAWIFQESSEEEES